MNTETQHIFMFEYAPKNSPSSYRSNALPRIRKSVLRASRQRAISARQTSMAIAEPQENFIGTVLDLSEFMEE
jgi:hypothetical protein